jgi:branched-chain amino acid transport system permease protein
MRQADGGSTGVSDTERGGTGTAAPAGRDATHSDGSDVAVVGSSGAAAGIRVPVSLDQLASPPRRRVGETLSPVVSRLRSVAGPAVALLVVQMVLFPVPLGIWLQGITVGLLGALVAVGMGLIYRANRILNFAQGDLGMAPATLSLILVQSFAWSYVLGLVAGLAAAVVVGALVELVVIRRFFAAPRLILTVATIGLAQVLVVVTLLLPGWLADMTGRTTSDVTATAERISFPWQLQFDVAPLVFRSDHVVAWVVAPLLLLAVALFLRYTAVGTAVRASAERSDRASMLGIPVRRLNTYVWVIAGVLSFAGLFLRAGVIGLPVGSAFSLNVLLLAFAALTLGRLTDLPCVAVSAVALGVLEQGVVWNDTVNLGLFTLDARRASLVAPMMGVVILAALLLRRVGQTRADDDASSSWQSTQDVRPVPMELRRLPEVRVVRLASVAFITAALVALPHFLGTADSIKASAVIVYAMVTVSVVVLTGWAGQVSLGQMGFVGIGAAVAAVATSQWGFDITLALLVAGVAGAGVAVVVGLPALRLRGLYLGVVTLAFAMAVSSYLLNPQFFSWIPQGRIERQPLLGRVQLESPTALYYLCLAGFAFSVFVVTGVRKSRTGRVLVAMRDNERGAQAFGINVTRAKLTSFALSGFVAAMAGGLLVHHQQVFSPGLIAPEQNLLVFTAAVVGGLGSLVGAVLGAVFLQGGGWFLPTEFQLLATGVGVLIVLLVLPGGLGGLVYRVRDLWLRSVALRNGVTSASLLADTAEPDNAPADAPVDAPTLHDGSVSR